EALAPSDDPSSVTRPGDVFGYDDRDVDGRPLTSDPLAYSVNPFMDEAASQFAWYTATTEPNAVVNTHPGGSFDGTTYEEMAHDPGEQQTEGAYLLTFTANTPGEDNQALLSKDFFGYQDGGHLTIWIDSSSNLRVRFQSEDGERNLRMSDDIVAGESYDVAFSYSADGIELYVNGVLEDTDDGFADGMLGNANSTLIGASARRRKESDDNAEWTFDGDISNIAVLDEEIGAVEAILLAENGNDPTILGAPADPAPVDPDPAPTDPDPDPEAETVQMELGYERISQPDRDSWTSVSFAQEIEDAVVVMGPLEFNGGNDALVHVRNVTSTGFEFQINEWAYHDGFHITEGVGWMAVSAGTHTLASGEVIAAGRAQSDATMATDVAVALDGFDDTPSVFAQVSSAEEATAVTARLTEVSTNEFQFRLQEEEAARDGARAVEQVDWIAVSDDIGSVLDLGTVDGGLNHRFTSVEFDQADGEMVLLADMQTALGGDTASLRYRNLEDGEVELAVAEERSLDNERWHVLEEVSVLTGVTGSYEFELA
ncbi:MAG: LamG-like jellyroll fold domain-containing protein, partial [Pseudomonadota bacterium]